MKKTTIIALLLAGQMGAMAQSINFHMTDGTVVTLNSSAKTITITGLRPRRGTIISLQ